MGIVDRLDLEIALKTGEANRQIDKLGDRAEGVVGQGLSNGIAAGAGATAGGLGRELGHIEGVGGRFGKIGRIFSRSGIKGGLAATALMALPTLVNAFTSKDSLGKKIAGFSGLAGGLIGTVAGSFFGPAGAVMGGLIGSSIGSALEPIIAKGLDSLFGTGGKKGDLSGVMQGLYAGGQYSGPWLKGFNGSSGSRMGGNKPFPVAPTPAHEYPRGADMLPLPTLPESKAPSLADRAQDLEVATLLEDLLEAVQRLEGAITIRAIVGRAGA